MSKHPLLRNSEQQYLRETVPGFAIGDTVKVSIKIIEGDRERLQVFQGTVIARKGTGVSETFTLHRIAYGEGMERVFCLHSPKIADIEVVRRGKVRCAKLYYLRDKIGKASKIKEKIAGSKATEKMNVKSNAHDQDSSQEGKAGHSLR